MLRILLADDNLLVLNEISGMIASGEMDALVVGQATDGRAAARLLYSLKPDLVIADVDMPGMSGVELAELIARRQLPVKLLALSSYDNFEYVRPIMRSGAVDYLLKQEMTPALLRDKLAEVRRDLTDRAQSARKEEVFSLLARQSFFSGLLLGTAEAKQREIMLRQAEFSSGEFTLLLLEVLGRKQPGQEEGAFTRAVLEVMSSILGTIGHGLACAVEGPVFAVLFRLDGPGARIAREKVQEYADVLRGNLARLLGAQTRMALTDSSGDALSLRRHYLAAREQWASEGEYSQHVQSCLRFIRGRYAQPVSLEEAAREIGISAAYLSQRFHAEVGITFIEYLTGHRIETAKVLLARSGLSISRVGEQVGLPNYNYFIKLFRDRAGMTPLRYRKVHGAKKKDGQQA